VVNGTTESWPKAHFSEEQKNGAYRVHILNPDGIHQAVKHQPLAVGGGVDAHLPEDLGQHSVRPLVGHRVELSVQLTHGYRLWVNHLKPGNDAAKLETP
jgi:hypothetical protein